MENFNINYDDGIRDFTINGDSNRILKVNVNDIGIIDRVHKAIEDTKKDLNSMKMSKVAINSSGDSADKHLEREAKLIRDVNNKLRKRFDQIFYKGASDIVFGVQNPIALNSSGMTIYEAFLQAFVEVMKPSFEEAAKASQKKVDKYLDSDSMMPAA